MKRRIIFALTLVGFTAMASQIVLMRELLIVFYGNELSFGIALASWLFWVSFGSLGIARWLVGKIKDKIIVFTSCEIALAFLLPLSVLAARFIPTAFNFSPGEIIGVFPMSVSAFVLLAPICAIGGFLFTLGCEVYRVDQGEAAQIGYVYVLEAIGATIGGFLTSLFLIRILPPLYIMFFISIFNLAAAFLLFWRRWMLFFSTGVILVGFIYFLHTGELEHLRGHSLQQQWKGYKLLTSKNSIYGNIAVTKRKDIYTLFTNGLYTFSIPDKLTSEMNGHFPLLEHPHPENVLLIGGGSSGQLREVLKHPVKRVDYVELDPLVIDIAKKYMPRDKALNSKRVRVITDMDGRLFIKRTDRKYDVIIINLPEPYTAQVNRLYTKEFYKEAEAALTASGILSFSLSSNPNYISKEQVELYLTLKKTLEEVFQDVKITPGETNHFLASKGKGVLTLDRNILIERLKKRNIEARYMSEYYLYSELSEGRIDAFERRLTKTEAPGVDRQPYALNRDFHPIAYYYDMVLWTTYFKYNLRRLFKAIDSKKIYAGFAFIYLALLVPIWVKYIKRKIPNWAVLTCVGTTGFAEMAFQIITLLSFQVLYGYVYYKLGLILTSYMIGLIFGGLVVTKSLSRIKDDYNLFIKTQYMIFIYPLILPILFWVFSGLRGNFSFWLGSNVIFPCLPVIPGLIGGFQFPLANKLYLKTINTGPSRSAGLTYGIDIFGACLGAIFVTVFLVPIIGIYASCFLVAGLNLVGLVLLLGCKKA
jgi:spermidine synthase